MKKFLPYILILVVLVGFFSPEYVFAKWTVAGIFESLIVSIANAFLTFLSWFAGFAGAILDYVLRETIVKMNVNVFGDGTAANPGMTGINKAWKIIKDLMNIAFIFILLYESIKIIIGQGSVESVKRFILGIVLASLLINFSLFFTKVLIDASNIVTVGVYRAILSTPVAPPQPGQPPTTNSIATILLSRLQLQSVYNTQNPSFGNAGAALIFLVGSSIIFLISTFVLLAITVNFIVRYIVLIVLLVLSPIAYMGMALDFIKPYSKKWWDSFTGQLVFAPVFMIMLMIVIELISTGFVTQGNFADIFTRTNINPNGSSFNATSQTATNPSSSSGLILNFAVVIGLLISTLTVSKGLAKKGAEQIGDMTGKLTGYAGGALIGGSAALMRNSVGRIGGSRASNAQLQEDAQKKSGFAGAWARTKLYTARAARDGSYDIRNATVPTEIIGDTVRGTLGRAKIGNFELGKAIGADDFRTSSVPVGSMMSKVAGTGEGGKSYGDTQAEKSKRLRDEQNKDKEELKLARAKEDIIKGSQNGATQSEIDAMEKALSTLSDKQTETLVDNNRQLLSSLNFANSISVKQLEALNKSDQFSDSEKTNLKDSRFNDINNAMTLGTTAAIASVKNKIRDLSDSELDMINSSYLGNDDFASHMKPGQVETVNKSSKFTTSQKSQLRSARQRPLMNALAIPIGAPGRTGTVQSLIRKMDYKTLASYVNVAGPNGTNIALDPDVLPTYNAKILTRMADEMNDADKLILKREIVNGNHPAKTWLNDPDKGGTYFI